MTDEEKRKRREMVPDGGVVRCTLLMMDSAQVRLIDGQPLTDSESQAFDRLLGIYGATNARDAGEQQRALDAATAEFRRVRASFADADPLVAYRGATMRKSAADALEAQVRRGHDFAEGARIAAQNAA